MISVNHLCKNFGDFEVIKDVSFEIEKGDIFGIIGQSGAGKSTLLRCINGLENYQSGSIVSLGKEVSSLNKKGRDQLIDNLFQEYATDLD